MPQKTKLIILTLIIAAFVISLFSVPATASVIKNQYKEYKAKFNNREDKQNYYKIKDLRNNSSQLYFYWKAICDAHKYDSDSQFKKLSPKTQDMCEQYYSYKGFKQYISYRNKYRNQNNDGETTATEAPFVCGTDTVKDADGNEYDTVEIGEQCWMAKNMNVGTKLASAATNPTDNGQIEKWCYNNDDSICATDGGLYNWNEAMKYSTTEGAQGICPSGWHIPTDGQLYTLENFLKDEGQTCDPLRAGTSCATAGTKLKTGGSSGFNFVLAGAMLASNHTFGARNATGVIWSTSPSLTDGYNSPLCRNTTSASSMSTRGGYTHTWGMSVRCLKD